MHDRFQKPPADYWPQIHEAVWDVDGVTCDAEIPVVSLDIFMRLLAWAESVGGWDWDSNGDDEALGVARSILERG